MALGFEKALGVPPLAIISAGFKNDQHYINYMNNIRKLDIPVINMDVQYTKFLDEKSEEIYNKLVDEGIDVLIHVAVCAGLQMLNAQSSGSKKRGDPNNDQNQNMYNLTQLGFNTRAKVVCFENAPAAYTLTGEGVVEHLKEISSKNNYSIQLVKTNTLLHGIPQSRQRTFIMFYRDTNPGLFEYESKEFKELAEYLDLIPKDSVHHDQNIGWGGTNDPFYQFILDYTNQSKFSDAIEKIVPQGTKKTSWTALQLTEKVGFDKAVEYFIEKQNDNYVRIQNHCLNKVSQGLGYWDSTPYLPNKGKFTNAIIGKNCGKTIHPTEERCLTIRELLWLMGHPHDFELLKPKSQWQHITQNVPVSTARYIGEQIKKYLENKLELSSQNFVKQDNIKQRLDFPKKQEPSKINLKNIIGEI